MKRNYLLGFDLGSGSLRALLLEPQSREVIWVSRPWSHPATPQFGPMAYIFDTSGAWKALGELVEDVLHKAKASAHQVVGIAASGFRYGTVVIDRKGEVLFAATNRDARAAEQGMALAAEHSQDFYPITGHVPNPICLAARLLWLKENDPSAFKAGYAALSISDWAAYQLCGEVATDFSQAGESQLFDLQKRQWSTEVLKALALPKSLLPDIQPAGRRLGKLTKNAAAHLGLLAGTPIAVGGGDTQCALLGMGVMSHGQWGIIAGTTTPVQMLSQELLLDIEMRLWSGMYLLPGLYVLESNLGQTGGSLELFAQVLYPHAPNAVARLCAEAASSPPGAQSLHSSIGGTVFNAASMSLPVEGLLFSSILLPPGHEGRSNVARAVLEGMAFVLRANIEQMASVCGSMPHEVFLSGGLSRSTLWSQIVSDVLGCRLRVSAQTEATALGAAFCAGVGAGVFPDLTTAAGTMAQAARAHLPGEEAEVYQSLYADWQALRNAQRPADSLAAERFIQTLMSRGTASSGDEPRLFPPAPEFKPRIYISAEVDERTLHQLQKLGEVTYRPYRSEGIVLTGDHLVETLKHVQVFVTEVDLLDAEALLQLPDLRLVIVCRGNPVNIDVEACTTAGVLVTHTPARNADAVADLAVGFMLMLARKLPPALAFLRQPGGEAGDMGRMGQAHTEFLGSELWRKTVGIIGGGAIGKKVIQRLIPFGAHLLLYDPYLSEEEATLLGAEKASFERLLAESDFISLHAPVNEETRSMIDAAAFEKMKPGAFLVNTARAALVDQEALLVALRNERLGGYATDVFPIEPPAADDPLLSFPNVIATPHLGGNTREVAAHQGEMVVNALQSALAGKPPDHLLNPQALERFAWVGKRKADTTALKTRTMSPKPGVIDLEVAQAVTHAGIDITEPQPTHEPGGTRGDDAEVTMKQNETQQKMIAILQAFAARLVADQSLAQFARGKKITFSFTIKDLDETFWMRFMDGKVEAGLGTPPSEAEVKLKMSADIFDGIFTGRINATKAATSGKLSFSGDTAKAMSFIRIQGNMSRLYTEARQQIGDPGDLTKLSAMPSPPPPVASPPPKEERPSTKTGDVRDQILLVVNELYAKGLITATGGNLSARCEDNPNEIWITPSAIFKGDLRAEMMVRMDLNGTILGYSPYSASSERRVHCAIYKQRPDITAVIHTHAPYATMMALTGTPFLPISTEAAFIGDLPVVPFIMPGTDALGEAVARAIGAQGVAVLMQNHGLVVAGSSVRRAADLTEIIETTAQNIITCKMLGVEPPVLPEEIVQQLKDIGSMMA